MVKQAVALVTRPFIKEVFQTWVGVRATEQTTRAQVGRIKINALRIRKYNFAGLRRIEKNPYESSPNLSISCN